MDATIVLYTAKWLLAELVRLLHTLRPDEAASIVDGLIEREVAWVWTHGDKKRVLRTGMTWKQQTLVLLLTEAGDVDEGDLVRWLEHSDVQNLRKDVLRPLHKARHLDYDANARTIRLLPPGVTAAEELVAAGS
jgi:hydroxypyruvate isomerase